MSITACYRTVRKSLRRFRAGCALRRHKVSFAESPDIFGKIIVVSRGRITLGRNIVINSSPRANPVDGCATCLCCTEGASVTIGDGCRISNARICALNSISIGKNVYIGAGCRILDSDFHPLDYEKRVANDKSSIVSRPVIIEDGAFLGTGSMILKGVRVGSRAVVGAGAVVTKDVPDGAVVGGNPAVIIKPHSPVM